MATRTRPSSRARTNGGRDINAQICFFPDGPGRFIAGEDTGQPTIPPGWGIFQLQGHRGASANQIGKLTPTYQPTHCTRELRLRVPLDGRVVTTDVGNQYPRRPGNGS